MFEQGSSRGLRLRGLCDGTYRDSLAKFVALAGLLLHHGVVLRIWKAVLAIEDGRAIAVQRHAGEDRCRSSVEHAQLPDLF